MILSATPATEFLKEVQQSPDVGNDGPALLWSWRRSGRLSVDDLRLVIITAWMLAERPAERLGVAAWVELFREAGFVCEDDEEAAPPTEPLVVYRGASWAGRRGMSWTTNLSVAAEFAERWVDDTVGHVFQTTVPPEAVLAFIGIEESRDECEVVVDPKLLLPIEKDSILPTSAG